MKTLLSMVLAAASLAGAEPVQPEARTVKYEQRDIVPVRGMLRFATIIVLPPEEVVVQAIVGDSGSWEVQKGIEDSNLVHIKPRDKAAAGSSTNLNVITATGHIYSFLLQEGSPPDLKVFIEHTDEMRSKDPVRLYTASQVKLIEERAKEAEAKAVLITQQSQARVAKETAAADQVVRRAAVELPKKIRSYSFQKGPPWNITEIFHNGSSTFVRGNPNELPVIGEKKDGKYKLLEFVPVEVEDGMMYRIPKVLDEGYVMIGKKKMEFR